MPGSSTILGDGEGIRYETASRNFSLPPGIIIMVASHASIPVNIYSLIFLFFFIVSPHFFSVSILSRNFLFMKLIKLNFYIDKINMSHMA